MEFDLTAVQLHQAAHQRKAQPGTGIAALPIAPLETVENPFHVVFGNADARIFYGENDSILAAPRGDGDPPAFRREFQRIGQKIEERLLEAPGIGVDLADIRGAIERQLELAIVRALSETSTWPGSARSQTRAAS